MTAIQTFTGLRPAAKQIILNYARRRGITSDGINEFLQPALRLERGSLPQADQFISRLTAAVKNQERILIFGDYDADGITATTILLQCLRKTAGVTPMWALPNRQVDDYGLDLDKAKSLHAQHRPTLLVCLDCGTNSAEAIGWLKQQGVDTLVVDHHPLESAIPDAIALANPKAHGRDTDDCCAAGLALLLCHKLASVWKAEAKWDRDSAVILAGIGTVADAVSMTPLNRAIVKCAINLMSDRRKVAAIPGLAALLANAGAVNQRQLQFDTIPKLNAVGRLGNAEPAVTLLTTTDLVTAKSIATHCCERNEIRKQLQRQMVSQAKTLAGVVVGDHPETPVLVLAESSWHHGVAGPAASLIAELYQRSVILLAPHGEQQWKGSGRSANGDHLGRWIRDMKHVGLVERGGGHARAVGLAATHAQLAPLQSAGLFLPMPQTDHESEQEVIGDIGELQPEEWSSVIALLAPYGRSNPFPIISVQAAMCQSEPTALIGNDNGQPWAVKAQFKTESGLRFTAIWRNAGTAMKQWRTGAHYDLVLELTAQKKGERTFHNWSVVACHHQEGKDKSHPEGLTATGSFQPPPRRANFQKREDVKTCRYFGR